MKAPLTSSIRAAALATTTLLAVNQLAAKANTAFANCGDSSQKQERPIQAPPTETVQEKINRLNNSKFAKANRHLGKIEENIWAGGNRCGGLPTKTNPIAFGPNEKNLQNWLAFTLGYPEACKNLEPRPKDEDPDSQEAYDIFYNAICKDGNVPEPQ